MSRTLAVFFTLLIIDVGAIFCLAQSPDEVLSRIKAEEGNDQSKIVREFGLNYIGGNLPCVAFEHAKRMDLTNSDTEKMSVIEIESSTCRMRFILVFSADHATDWHYLGTIPLEERNDSPKYALIRLTLNSSQVPAFLVTGNSFANATGYQQENTQIFAITRRELHMIFNEPESVSLGMPSGPTREKAHMYVAKQHSTFDISKTPTDGYTSIRETRLMEVNGKQLTMHFEYAWVDSWRSFCATVTTPSGP